MDAYEATKTVFQRIQVLDSENASKIMGLLLIQDHGEKEMIRLAFGPETLIHSVIVKAKKELGLGSPNTPLSLSRQNSCPSSTKLLLNASAVNFASPLSLTCSSWTNSSAFSDFQTLSDDLSSPNGYVTNSPSEMNCGAAPFYGNGGEVDLIDELELQDQLSFLNDGGSPTFRPKNPDFFYSQQQDLSNDAVSYTSYAANWGGNAGLPHRRSCSVSDICLGSDDMNGGFGWKPCLYYARGFCKNGSTCRFVHGEGGGALGAADGGAVAAGSPSKFEMMEQHCQELLRSKSAQQQKLAAASQLIASTNYPYSPVISPRTLMMNDTMHKFGGNRFERSDFGMNCVNPVSRQIYLTFPADSTFKEEDVSNYFSIFGPVQDVRIPYQQKRMFGFVTFDYSETVKLILAKGNPHFVGNARVLVKPYKEKGKIPDKNRRQMERGDYPGCGSPTGIESRDPYDPQLGARMFCNTQDMLWRRKLEEQADLQRAIELQNRRLMGLQLLDVKRNNHHRALSTDTIISSPTCSPTFNQNSFLSGDRSSPKDKEENGSIRTRENPATVASNKEATERARDSSDEDYNGNGKQNPPIKSGFQDSSEHNLPDSPFASPKAAGNNMTALSNETRETENGNSIPPTTNNSLIPGSALFPATSCEMAPPFKSCHFQVPRLSSGQETIGI